MNEKALTLGVLAERLSVPIHKVQYLVASRGIQPIARAGNLRIFDESAVERLRTELVKRSR